MTLVGFFQKKQKTKRNFKNRFRPINQTDNQIKNFNTKIILVYKK